MAEKRTISNSDNSGGTERVLVGHDGDNRRDHNVTDVLIRLYNEWNVNADYSIVATTTDDASWNETTKEWDVDWNKEEVLVSSTTLSSGGGQDYETLTDDWEFIAVKVSPASDPTSGDFVVVDVSRIHE